MKSELKEKVNKLFKSKFVKIIGIGIIVLIVFGIIFISSISNQKLDSLKTNTMETKVAVKKGDLNIGVNGSGNIYFTNSNKIFSRTSATVKKVNFKTGDKVKAGEVIYELDDKDAQTSLDVSKQGLEQNLVAEDASNEAVGNLSIKAPFTGQVSNIAVNVGDVIQAGATVLTITDTSKLKVLLTFNASDVGQITIGQAANLSITSTMQVVNGTVTYISNQPSATIAGGQLYTVEIQLENPGAILGGMTSSAEVQTPKGSVASTNTASLNYIKKVSVISKTGGTVHSIPVKEKEKVDVGEILVGMENNDVIRAQQTANIRIATCQDQINTTISQLDYFKIPSPIDGVLSTVSFQVGDTINAGTQVSEVSDPTQMKVDIPVDEIDVAKVKPGQKVNITVESLPSTLTTPVQGEVESVAVKGASVNGVTTYLVTVKVKGGFDILRGGMNANAEIQVAALQEPNGATTK